MDSQFRNDLVKRLIREPSFIVLKSNEERVRYVLDQIMSFDTFQSNIATNVEKAREETCKSLLKAKCYQGEAELQSNYHETALASIHQAILYVPFDEMTLKSKLYSIKARIHYDMKNYRAALWSCEYASEIDDTSLDNTMLRVLCLKQLGRYEDASNLIGQMVRHEMAYRSEIDGNTFQEVKEQIQQHLFNMHNTNDDSLEGYYAMREQWQAYQKDMLMSKKNREPEMNYVLDPRVIIQQSPVVGRHFIATQEIPEGTILLHERPYSIVMEMEYLGKKCSHCQHDLEHRYIPCEHCIEAVYCDSVCARQAWTTYHQSECGMQSLLRSITSTCCHVFKMISRVGPCEAFDIQSSNNDYTIDQYLKETADQAVRPINEQINYKMSSILWDHDSKHGTDSNAYHTVIAIETVALLDLVHKFRLIRPSTQFLLSLIVMVIIDIRRIIFNVFGWHEYDPEDWSVRGHVANCQCLVGSLINHSCVANTSWEWKDGRIYFTTKQSIMAGEQITITYGPSKDQGYQQRQQRLNNYFFACSCAACYDDAIRGNVLRCRDCNKGPVVLGSASNDEPTLNGKCLLCFKLYNQFQRTTRELANVKTAAMTLASLTMIIVNDPKYVQSKTVEIVEQLLDLSLVQSESVTRAILHCSQVLERLNLDSILDRVEDRIRIALLLDRALPTPISVKLIDGQNLRSMKYWFDSLCRWIPLLEQQTSKESTNTEDNKKIESTSIWTAMQNFYYRYMEMLKSFSTKEDTSGLLLQIVAKQIGYVDSQLECFRVQFHCC